MKAIILLVFLTLFSSTLLASNIQVSDSIVWFTSQKVTDTKSNIVLFELHQWRYLRVDSVDGKSLDAYWGLQNAYGQYFDSSNQKTLPWDSQNTSKNANFLSALSQREYSFSMGSNNKISNIKVDSASENRFYQAFRNAFLEFPPESLPSLVQKKLNAEIQSGLDQSFYLPELAWLKMTKPNEKYLIFLEKGQKDSNFCMRIPTDSNFMQKIICSKYPETPQTDSSLLINPLIWFSHERFLREVEYSYIKDEIKFHYKLSRVQNYHKMRDLNGTEVMVSDGEIEMWSQLFLLPAGFIHYGFKVLNRNDKKRNHHRHRSDSERSLP